MENAFGEEVEESPHPPGFNAFGEEVENAFGEEVEESPHPPGFNAFGEEVEESPHRRARASSESQSLCW